MGHIELFHYLNYMQTNDLCLIEFFDHLTVCKEIEWFKLFNCVQTITTFEREQISSNSFKNKITD